METLKLVGKRIIIDKSKIIYNKKLDENWQQDWEVKAGQWECKDGCLIGTETGNKGGILFFKEFFTKNVMMTFTMSTVLPATRDLNAVFCAKWDDSIDYLGDCYVCGFNGWYENKSGIEKLKKDFGEVFCGMSATAIEYTPGTEVRMTVGAINGHCFMFVNDKLVAEMFDEREPFTEGHLGFSPYCTILKIKDIEIREIYYENVKEYYDPEF